MAQPAPIAGGNGFGPHAPMQGQMMLSGPAVEDRWSYIDAQGTVQGPFTHDQLLVWVRQGHFCSRTLARREGEAAFRTLLSYGLMQKEASDDAKEIEETLTPLIGTCWFYIDSNGVQQGPFDLHKMREWNPRFFDGETLVRCGDSSSSEFVPLRTTVIAQTLDDQAFSHGGFYAGSGGSGVNDGGDEETHVLTANSSNSLETPTESPVGAVGAIVAPNKSASDSVAAHRDQRVDARFESAERRAVSAEKRAQVAEECMATAQRELASVQERFVATENVNKELASELEVSMHTLREKVTLVEELNKRVESMKAELSRLQVFEMAFSMMKDGIDLIQGLGGNSGGAGHSLGGAKDSKRTSPPKSSSSASGKQPGLSGSRNSKKNKLRRSNNNSKTK